MGYFSSNVSFVAGRTAGSRQSTTGACCHSLLCARYTGPTCVLSQFALCTLHWSDLCVVTVCSVHVTLVRPVCCHSLLCARYTGPTCMLSQFALCARYTGPGQGPTWPHIVANATNTCLGSEQQNGNRWHKLIQQRYVTNTGYSAVTLNRLISVLSQRPRGEYTTLTRWGESLNIQDYNNVQLKDFGDLLNNSHAVVSLTLLQTCKSLKNNLKCSCFNGKNRLCIPSFEDSNSYFVNVSFY